MHDSVPIDVLVMRKGECAKAHCNEQEAKGCNRRSHPFSAFLSVLTPCALPKIVLVAPNTDPLSCDIRLYELTLKLMNKQRK